LTPPTSLPPLMDAATSSAAIAGSVISALCAELAKERTTNTRVREYAECKILRLEAQVALRDAELQACAMHTHTHDVDEDIGEWVMPPVGKEKGKGKARIEAASLSREEKLSVMGLVGSRNKQLEMEVHRLQDRLQDVKLRQPSRSSSTTPTIKPSPKALPALRKSETDDNTRPDVLQDMQIQVRRLSEAIDALVGERRAMQALLERERTGRTVHEDTTKLEANAFLPPISDLLMHEEDLSSGGEESMDLATPLQPTILLDPTTLRPRQTPPAPRTRMTTRGVEPANIPLPSSPSPPPQLIPSPPPIPIPPASAHLDDDPHSVIRQPTPGPSNCRPRSRSEQRMDALESNLVLARADIAQRGITLRTLRAVMDELPLQHASTSQEENEGEAGTEERLKEDDVDERA